ncbi:spermidine/spermine N(1)-acetyltransferase [Leuconostoc litchii]|uniref:GNAT family N-acetyltransferase n=1 Tax=Leuconostoc litchii TaxID=1981069 RepID=UPI001FCC5C04|nr:N-acetyltransferase [Leuconostoc litchii]GMA68979.1 spermidine/spermine N(1)-acetyltransferase [Leuconostoc litchii]
MTIKLKKVTAEDVKLLRQISIETFTDTFGSDNSKADLENYLQSAYNEQKLQKEIGNNDTVFQLVYYKNQLAGYLKINVGQAQSELKESNGLEVERIYIRTEFHRSGLGQHLINFALEQANRLGKKYVWLGVWENNNGAIAFYEKQGFTPFSEHIFDLGGDLQRDILMKKRLGD